MEEYESEIEQKNKEELVQQINEMLEVLPISECLRLHDYMLELYFS